MANGVFNYLLVTSHPSAETGRVQFYVYDDGVTQAPYYMAADGVARPVKGADGSGNVAGAASSVDSNVISFDGTTGKILKDSGVKSSELLTESYSSITSAYTSLSNQFIFADSASGAFDVTLPASPIQGDRVSVMDITGNLATNNITLQGNGNNIMGSSTSALDIDFSTTEVIFNGTEWRTDIDAAALLALATKQDTLISGTNIKTINSESLLGSSNIVIPLTPTYFEEDATTNVAHSTGAESNVDSMEITTPIAAIYRADATISFTTTGSDIVSRAQSDLTALKSEISGLTSTGTHALAITNETISPGVIDITGAATYTGNITFNAGGVPDSLFIIRISTTLTTTTTCTTTLSGGAKASNIFFVTGGAISIAASSQMEGTFISATTFANAAGAVINGRCFAGTTLGSTTTKITIPTEDTSLSLGVLDSFAAFSNAGAVTNTGTSATECIGNVGTPAAAAGNTGWIGLKGNTYFVSSLVSIISFAMAIDGVAIESTRRAGDGKSVYFPSKSLTTASGEVISIVAVISLGTMTTGERSIFALKLT